MGDRIFAPSTGEPPFESFSIVVCESWVQSRPVLVSSGCEVLVGQTRRSHGGIPYSGFAEFEAAVDLLIDDPILADQLGRNGRAYVEQNYSWDVVVKGLLETIDEAIENFGRRTKTLRAGH